jgi:hypothetical protein
MVYFYIKASNTITCICIYTMCEHTVIHIIASNPDLFHYLLWVYYFWFKSFWFMPTFSGMQLGHKMRPICQIKSLNNAMHGLWTHHLMCKTTDREKGMALQRYVNECLLRRRRTTTTHTTVTAIAIHRRNPMTNKPYCKFPSLVST